MEEGAKLALEEIKAHCLCRAEQVEGVYSIFADDTTMESLFVYGNTATGKTMLIKTMLHKLQLKCSYVSCIEQFTSKHIYQHILNDVEVHPPTACSTMMDFCRHLRSGKLPSKQPFYIVLDKAERLRKMDAHLLPAFLRLAELTQLNVCVVLISELIFEKFTTTSGLHSPVKMHFPDYSKDQLKQVMTLDCPENYSVELYKSFCSAVVDVFFHVGRDLNELRHLAMLNFPKYCEPISEGEVEQTDYRKLWMLITPVLRKALQSVYVREVSSKQWESMQQQNNAVLPTAKYSTKGEVEVPYYSKYLLLASFFASYNPATTDRRFFAKKTAGRLSTRTKRAVKTAKKQNKKFIGPKAFQIDRLMAIFYSIVEGCVSPSANILSQLATLTTLKLLVKTSADDQIDLPKYKCVVPVEFAVSIGKQVDIDVHQYLYDL